MSHRRRAAVLVATACLLAAGCSDDGDSERSVEAFCTQLHEVKDLDEILARLDARELDDALAELEALRDVAPDAIRDDVDELVTGTASIVEVVSTAVGDPMDAAEQALRAQEARRAQTERAGRAVEDYAAAECDVDLRSTTSSTVAGVPSVPATGVAPLD